ncbi:protein RALF-like 24 [Silene latifolia]|uniref:protein RALF-like 24 n=1 Tax=Silene latifolia TaxID=37657 RepID=UPI003D772E30
MPTKSIKLFLLLTLIILQTHLNFSTGFSNSALNCDEKVKNSSTMEEIDGNNNGIIRRILSAERKFVSYETLKRDVVPCSTAGSSYYRCGAAPANHYSRGCSVITQCARFS